jgi:hypothetical protein
MYSALQLDRTTKCCLSDWLADETFAEEEHGAAHALACVNVASEVTLAVADKVCHIGVPCIMQAALKARVPAT